MTKRFSVIMLLVGLLGFLLIFWSVIDQASWVTAFDTSTRDSIRSLSSPTMDILSIMITTIGNPHSIITLTIFVTIGLLIIKQWSAVSFLLINMVTFSTLNHLIKIEIQRPRPPFQHLVYAGGYSFPSGHASGALLFFGSLSLLAYYLISNRFWQKLISGVTLILALLIGLSRIYVSVHYPSDVLAGFLLATAGLGASWYFFIQFKLLHPKES